MLCYVALRLLCSALRLCSAALLCSVVSSCSAGFTHNTQQAPRPLEYKCIFGRGIRGLRVFIGSIAAVAILHAVAGHRQSIHIICCAQPADAQCGSIAAALGRLEVDWAARLHRVRDSVTHTELHNILLAESPIYQIAKATAWKRPARESARTTIINCRRPKILRLVANVLRRGPGKPTKKHMETILWQNYWFLKSGGF